MNRYEQSTRPPIRLGIDFGAGILVIGRAAQDGSGYRSVGIAGWSQAMPGTGGVPVYGIPVLIHYDGNGERAIGDEVVQAGSSSHPATARWLRNYLLDESPVRIPVGPDNRITFRDAATDFLREILLRAARECTGISEVFFSLPTDAPEWYAEWLGCVAHAAGIASWYTLDENAAAAAGYGLAIEENQIVVIIRCDEMDLGVSVVRCEGSPEDSRGQGMRVIGRACEDTGCKALDGWIAQDILERNRMKCRGSKAQRIRDGITQRIAEVHRQLAASDEAVLDLSDSHPGIAFSAQVSREDIRRIMTAHGFPAALDRTIGRARAAARARGCEKPPVAVLMTGRGCAIPAVQERVRQQFSGVPVLCDHPVDAIARGAALFMPCTTRPDRIRNDYALRYWDPKSREHRYRFLVRSGARYPSAGQVARITISASYDGQTRLGIPLYEISTSPEEHAPALELVSDPAGGIRQAGPAGDAGPESRAVLANERTPTLLTADPPAIKGEPRFELTFTLDREKQLRVAVRDLVTGTLVKKDAPVHRLT